MSQNRPKGPHPALQGRELGRAEDTLENTSFQRRKWPLKMFLMPFHALWFPNHCFNSQSEDLRFKAYTNNKTWPYMWTRLKMVSFCVTILFEATCAFGQLWEVKLNILDTVLNAGCVTAFVLLGYSGVPSWSLGISSRMAVNVRSLKRVLLAKAGMPNFSD